MPRPSLYERVTNTSGLDAWVRKRKETKERKKNRKTIDDFITKIGKKSGGSLSLDDDGVCAFPYKKFTIVIEVTEKRTDICQFRTTVCDLGPGSNDKEIIKVAMALQSEDEMAIAKKSRDSTLRSIAVPLETDSPHTRAFLHVLNDGVHMHWEFPIKKMRYDDCANCLDEFLATTVEYNKRFEIARALPKRSACLPEKQEEETGGFRSVLKCI